MLRAEWVPYNLQFKFEARTSRETMRVKQTYFVKIYSTTHPERPAGVGECALFRGLSEDDVPIYERLLSHYAEYPEAALDCPYSSIRFGFETAMADYQAGGTRILKDSSWTRGESGIRINGLVWMGDKATMLQRIGEKIDSGFSVLKLKIGGIDFDQELDLLRYIRSEFSSRDLELRLDANGSFKPEFALERLTRLSEFKIHSIEQPITAGQYEQMAALCQCSPIPIALDEELIGCRSHSQAYNLLEKIRPQYIILKPALCGGFSGADDLIDAATKLGILWWATSALESDIGLNAIAQWLSVKDNSMPQGLGTGQLYHNNIESPLECRGERLVYNPIRNWGEMDKLQWRQ